MEDFEKIGVFYLGQIIDPKTGKDAKDLLLYDSKNLTTHAVCLGMTGSGKTGLGITILEEAGLDKIPAIIIDPKGDVSNLVLTFPDLSGKDFLPWIDEQEAERKGETPKAFADETADAWKKGLASSGESAQRIKKLQDSVEMVIYTPGNNAGVPISILSSFEAPTAEELKDAGALRDRVLSLSSSLLGLLGIDADPIKSREQILISSIIEHVWTKGGNLSIATLIQMVQKPPFTQIGALDVDTFYPQKERSELSIRINSLLASPSFRAWMEGEPLDIKQLLYTKEGKPKFAIFSIAHLSDSERMFFVTLLLNEMITWMRRQPGTSSLRAMLYMDEIFGYFPPTAMPPSKLPMITLLKQARAFGVGVVLATQNPVDLDYKGLSNCGTWFIGKLQTARDKSRVTEGLKIASNGEIDAEMLDKLLSNIAQRTFIMRSIYEKEPVLFRTRWALSYLRGPMTLAQIKTLTNASGREYVPAQQPSEDKSETVSSNNKPIIPSDIPEFFINPPGSTGGVTYTGQVFGTGKLHFVNTKSNIDAWREIFWAAPADDDGQSILWDKGKNNPELKSSIVKTQSAKAQFGELPPGLLQVKNYTAFKKSFDAFLYQTQELTILQVPELSLTSKVDESEGDFKARVTIALRENRDTMAQKLRDKYADKIAALTKKLKSSEEKVSERKQKKIWQIAETVISFLSTLLGALLGRGITKGTINQAGTSFKRASKTVLDQQQASQAEDDAKSTQEQLDNLNAELQKSIDGLYTTGDIDNLKMERITVNPRKSDISIDKIGILWLPK